MRDVLLFQILYQSFQLWLACDHSRSNIAAFERICEFADTRERSPHSLSGHLYQSKESGSENPQNPCKICIWAVIKIQRSNNIEHTGRSWRARIGVRRDTCITHPAFTYIIGIHYSPRVGDQKISRSSPRWFSGKRITTDSMVLRGNHYGVEIFLFSPYPIPSTTNYLAVSP